MSFWSFDNLRSVLGASWAALPPPGVRAAPAGVSTDSRTLTQGQAFFAIKGERTDGHVHVSQAARVGAVLAVVGSDYAGPVPAGLGVLRVADTTKALLRLAGAYRKTLESTRVIGVTGSNGKTTTKQMIHAVLSGALRGSASAKSFNNHIGVPLTLFGGRPGDQYLICEIGTNAPGEVAELARAAAPDIAVITGVGREHLEELGSLRRVAQEEASQTEFLRRGGLAVIHAEAPHLREHVEAHAIGEPPATGQGGGAREPQPRRFGVVTFGMTREADLRVGLIRQEAEGLTFRINDRHIYRLPLLGRHNAVNAAAAVAVARRFGVDHEAIAAGLAAVERAPMRLEPIELGGVRFINDAYNANPDSMAAALETFAEVAAGPSRRVAVLGDMLELGEHTPSAHAEAVARALDPAVKLDLLILVGPLMARAARSLHEDRILTVEEPSDRAVEGVAHHLRPGDCVLLKGSRRLRLERVLDGMRTRSPEPPVEVKARPARRRRPGVARAARRK